jgi:hypothetical protein
MNDRSKPPRGLYDVYSPVDGYWTWEATPDKYYESRVACLESCWAHHDAIATRARLRVLAKLIAWLRTDDNTSSQWIADEIERIAYKGAMERAKGEGE